MKTRIFNLRRACSLRFTCFFLISAILMVCTVVAGAAQDNDKVVASQGGATVTFGDIDQFAETIPAYDREHFFDDPNRIQTLITGMLVQKQLVAQALAKGLDKDPDVVAAKDSAKPAALAKAEVDDFKAGIKVPDLGVLANEQYIGHPEQYVVAGHTTVKDILVSTKSRNDEEATKIAEDISERARAAPDTFDALIEKYSDDNKKGTTHGLVTITKQTSVDQSVVAAAAQLPLPNSISMPIKTYAGYHVIMLVERVLDKPKNFDEVRSPIIAALKQKFIDDQVRNHVNVLRNKPLDANRDYVASLRTRFAKVSAAAQPPAQGPSAGKKTDDAHR